MRSTEERIEYMHQRAAEIDHQRRSRYAALIQIIGIAACVIIIITLGIIMPGISKSIKYGTTVLDMGGSIFSDNNIFGYVVIAIIAFLLGIALTIFCYRIRKWKDYRKNEDSR